MYDIKNIYNHNSAIGNTKIRKKNLFMPSDDEGCYIKNYYVYIIIIFVYMDN